MPENRPTFDEMFMSVTEVVAQRSTCLRRQVGAVLVQDKHIIATGYNGAPPGLKHCTDMGFCEREKLGVPSGERHEICRAIHAEQNVIIQAALHGRSTKGATLYTTLYPCSICAKIIVAAGIERVVYRDNYPDWLTSKMLSDAGVVVLRTPNNERD